MEQVRGMPQKLPRFIRISGKISYVLQGKGKIMKRMICIALSALMLLSLLVGCSGGTSVGYNKDYSGAGTNTDRSFRIVGGWTKTGIGTHFHSGPDMGPVVMYSIEGCMQYTRGTKHFTYLVAEDFVHAADDPNDDVKDGESVIVIRDNAKWHDGGKVVAMDVMSYYALCYSSLTTYLSDMYVMDDNNNGDLSDDLRIKLVWKPWKEPTDYAKDVLLAQDTKNCSIQYAKFKDFVDASLDLIYNGIDGIPNEIVTEQSEGQGEERLGRHASNIVGALGSIYQQFRGTAVKPDGEYDGYYFMGTGPFKVKSVSENQIVLVKNEDYYLADQVGFDSIIATQYSNSNMLYSDLQNGLLDFVDGCPDSVLLNSILEANDSLVHYKYHSQGAAGVFYNLEKPIWEDDNVRLAFQYIFDRELIKNTVNPYATTAWKPMMVMSPVEARQYLDAEVYNSITEYSHDTAKAVELLEKAGWSKKGGKWYDANDQPITLTLGYINVPNWAAVAQQVKAQLEAFGIDCILKSGNDMTTWFSTACSTNSIYDFVVYHTELNTYGTHPGGSMKHFFEIIEAPAMHMPVAEDGHYSVTVDLLDQNDPTKSLGKVRVWDLYSEIYCTEGATLKQYANSIVLGMSKYNYGVQFFENVTGSFFNADRIGGLPSVELFTQNRNMTFIPEPTDEEHTLYAVLNHNFSQAVALVEGFIYAR